MNMRIQNRLDKRLKGYHKTFRGRFLLIKNRTLNSGEYILWDVSYSILADWDKKNHPDIFGTFDYSQEEIASLLACDKSTISRNSEKLFELGLWKEREDGRIEICGFDIQENLAEISKQSGVVDLQKYLAQIQQGSSQTQQQTEKIQSNSIKETSDDSSQTVAEMQHHPFKEPLVSSKYGIKFHINTKEQYEKVKEQVETLGQILDEEKGWNSQEPKFVELVNERQKLAEEMLMYEIDHDMLPDFGTDLDTKKAVKENTVEAKSSLE